MYGNDHLDGAAIVQPKKTNVMIYFKTHYVKTHFGNGHRSPLVTGNAPVTDQVLQISQEM
jgi:hypothetical protein